MEEPNGLNLEDQKVKTGQEEWQGDRSLKL